MKKIISAILSAALVVSLMPAFVFAAEENVESYVYNFKSGLHNTSAGAPAGYITVCEDWISEDSSEGEWTCNAYYHFGNGSNAGKHSGDYFTFRPKINKAERVPTYSPGFALNANTQFMSALAIKIEVKNDGVYIPELTLTTEDSSPMWEVFLTEVDRTLTKDNLSLYLPQIDSADRLGIIDAYGNGADVKKTFLNKSLEKGSYYLILVSNGMNEKCTFTKEADNVFRVELFLKSFSLTNVKEPVKYNEFEYNLTTSALADPSTKSNYCDDIDYNDDDIWHCKKLLTLGYDALAESENSFAMHSDIYCRDGSFSETGIKAHLWAQRYVEVTANALFVDTDKDGKAESPNPNNTTSTPYGSSTYFALKIEAPKAGNYKLYLYNQNSDTYGCISDVFFSDSTEPSLDDIIKDTNGVYELPNMFDCTVSHADGVYIGDVTVSKDDRECLIIFSPDYDGYSLNSNGIQLSKSRKNFQALHLSGIKLVEIPTDNLDVKAEQKAFDEIKKVKGDEIAEAVSSGLSNISTVNILSTEINGDEAFDETARKVMGTYGSFITVEAEEKEGYDFLYWAKGIGSNRKAVSDDREYSFKAVSGGTWITAVYKNKASDDVSVVFYNGNGEEIERRLVEVGSEITIPSLPSLRGHDSSIGWAIGSADKLYQPNEVITASGKQMLFVAQYNDPTAGKITVKVNGSELGKFAYGEKVSVSADERENKSGQKVFVFWKKDGEIVSFDKSYSFLASEDCELEACYEMYRPITDALRKIIIKEDGDNLMAEFIGVGSAVEKGIIFGGTTFGEATHKVAMTQSGNQLSAIEDIDSDVYVGYAILADGTVIYDK